MQKRWCHSCILLNMIVAIILWPVMGSRFSWIWTTPDVDSVERWCRHTAETCHSEQKNDISIMWNGGGFYVADRLSNDRKINSDNSVTNVPITLEDAIFLQGRARHQKWLAGHRDNCAVHTSRASTDWLEEHGMRGMPWPPCWSDWAAVTSTYFL
jgi:hypothetical protein